MTLMIRKPITASERTDLADIMVDRMLLSANDSEQDVCRHIRTMLLDLNLPLSEIRATCAEKRNEHHFAAEGCADRHASWEAIAAQLDRRNMYHMFITFIRRYR